VSCKINPMLTYLGCLSTVLEGDVMPCASGELLQAFRGNTELSASASRNSL